ncbi:MAG: hypothetical protein ACOCYW_06565 [Roseicyclus sp.]
MIWPFRRRAPVLRKIMDDPERALDILSCNPELPAPFSVRRKPDCAYVGGYSVEVAGHVVWSVCYNTGGDAYTEETPLTDAVRANLEMALADTESALKALRALAEASARGAIRGEIQRRA